MVCKRIKSGIVCFSQTFKANDPQPDNLSYLDNYEYHEVQQKAGLRQKQCGKCGKYHYPQDMSKETITIKYRKTKYGQEFTKQEPICKKCASKQE